ncbi:EAL domain-containing protein [Virgibacillus litoralis]|uniref:EAL domain-containing protein (Putative c-di-GMP-specific phosphodiesterase class I) n=1 Tax=Virgibacillus litoralis TaxID=578221 RepID=A0ABS4HGT8_9BACI|nr:EAL domain-containing protein [Virgibacillus litoralis]MBP1949924.1 EAL domain-containing protein (putative c-di-GMP-specific phosphodiesterase class I) [Virgibacillus litoralis]
MDPLDIVDNLHKVKPVYQPIISAVRYDVIGYEVLGRFHDDHEWRSLGAFFHDSEVPEEFKVEVDQYILEIAISKMLELNKEGFLFINRNAKQLMIDNGERLLETLLTFEQIGFSMDRVVIEVTENDFDEEADSLSHLLQYYKTYGIKIAIDRVGAKSSNIDRIRQLEPHILKINTKIIRTYNTEGFQDIMYSLSMLARRIGAAMLFENIEVDSQLYFAWKHGGRYYQGHYLAQPEFDFASSDSLAVNLEKEVNVYIQREKSLVEQRLNLVLSWEEKIKELLSKWEGPDKADTFIQDVTDKFNEQSFRMFICNGNGLQVSSNFRKRDGVWEQEPHEKGSNWAFRPYFLENVMQMKTWKKGMLSDIYSDIETREMVRTFSYPLTDQHFLFIDIGYTFIYENEFLLI